MPIHSGSFKKGDPRINRKGRPVLSDWIKELGLKVLQEEIEIPGLGKITKGEAIIRRLLASKHTEDVKLALAYIFGKPKESIDLQADAMTTIKVVYVRTKKDE